MIAFRGGRFRNVLLGLVVIPFFTNFLIRTLAWRTILGDQSWFVERAPQTSGSSVPTDTFLRTPIAVIGGLTYNFLPFMVLPIYVALEKIDPGLVDAARDLYSNTWRAFRKIVFPMSLPGVFAGSLLVFIPAAGDFVNAYYLGNAHTTMIGNVVQDQFLVQGDYPGRRRALVRVHGHRHGARDDLRACPRHRGPDVSASGTVTSPAGRVGRIGMNVIAAFGLLYLFAPIFVIVAFSFNEPKGRFNAVWQKFTFDNWLHPFANRPLVDALLLSLRIALISTVIATILGTFIAIALVRYRIRGGEPVNFLLVLPLTAPEIVLGASLLTLFIRPTCCCSTTASCSARRRSSSRTSCSCVSYVAITVRGACARPRLDARGRGDGPRRVTDAHVLEGHAAADHARHPRGRAPAAFALSIDDFIITYFVSGPDTTTFPVRIFNQSRTATPPQINVLSTMILLVSITVLAAGTAFGAYRQNRTT